MLTEETISKMTEDELRDYARLCNSYLDFTSYEKSAFWQEQECTNPPCICSMCGAEGRKHHKYCWRCGSKMANAE